MKINEVKPVYNPTASMHTRRINKVSTVAYYIGVL